MNCREAQTRISDALTAGTPLRADALAHWESCTACQEFHEERQKLFSALDAGLAIVANRPLPPSLFPRVREQIEVAKPRRAWFVRWAPAGTALVLVCVVALPLMHRGDRKTAANVARTADQKGTETVTKGQLDSMVAPKTSTAPRVASTVRPKQAATHPRFVSARTEVLVGNEEARGFNHLVASIRQKPGLGQGFLKAALLPPEEMKPVPLIEIAELRVSPLADEQW